VLIIYIIIYIHIYNIYKHIYLYAYTHIYIYDDGSAAQECVFLRKLCIEMGVHQNGPNIIYQDCKAAHRASQRHSAAGIHKEAEVFVAVV
jgi:hypothetical protein